MNSGAHHGMSRTPVYGVWKAMRSRCNNPNNKEYDNYGGRGIKVCDRWQHSVVAFVEDMGERPPGTQIERVENNGNYEPGNCVWATPKQNSRNKRVCRMVTIAGVSRPLTEWCEINKIDPHVAFCRVHQHGWTGQDAVTIPLFARTRWTNQTMEN